LYYSASEVIREVRLPKRAGAASTDCLQELQDIQAGLDSRGQPEYASS